MILADTNVVSELMRDAPDQAVLAWAQTLGPSDVGISVVTVLEIETGIGQLPDGRRRAELQRRWAAVLAAYSDGIAVYDVAAARATAEIVVDGRARGRSVHLADAQIAGTCLALGAELATRNVRDFQDVAGLTVVNPFEWLAGSPAV